MEDSFFYIWIDLAIDPFYSIYLAKSEQRVYMSIECDAFFLNFE